MLQDDGVRLPGAHRLARERKAAKDGLQVADAVVAQLEKIGFG